MDLNTGKNHSLKVGKNRFLSRFIKLSGLQDRQEITASEAHDEVSRIIDCIRNAREEWVNTTIQFENADEWEIIDYYTYKLKACEVKYQYYLKKAKEMGIKLDRH